jgi:hypothetical protein
LVAVAAVQPAIAKISANKLSLNTASTNAPTGTVEGVTAIVLPNGHVVRR